MTSAEVIGTVCLLAAVFVPGTLSIAAAKSTSDQRRASASDTRSPANAQTAATGRNPSLSFASSRSISSRSR